MHCYCLFTFLAAINLRPHGDVTRPRLGVETKELGLDWRMQGMENWGVAVDIASKNLAHYKKADLRFNERFKIIYWHV